MYNMSKKNTLLYLDENLVKLAKKYNLNISQITEIALKSRLFPLLPKSERKSIEQNLTTDFEHYIEDLKNHNSCFFLRTAIKSLKLEGFERLEDTKFNFKNGLNVIYDPSGFRGIIILRSILEALGNKIPSPPREETENIPGSDTFLIPPKKEEVEDKGKISVLLFPEELVVDKSDGVGKPKVKSVLINEPVEIFGKRMQKKFVNWIKKKYGCQIILVTRDKRLLKLADNVIKVPKVKKFKKKPTAKEVKLKVVWLTAQDEVGKGIVRLDSNAMKKIGVRSGDVIEIEGGRKTAAIAIQAYPADEDLKMIRMDEITIKNAKSSVGEHVKIRRADVKDAEKVVIAPAEKGTVVHINPDLIKKFIYMRPVCEGDIFVPTPLVKKRGGNFFEEFFGTDFTDLFFTPFPGEIKFVVLSTRPAGIVRIVESTDVKVLSELPKDSSSIKKK